MVLIKVNGILLEHPTSYKLKLADIDGANSGRSESGYMIREVVRRKVRVLYLEFANISTTEQQKIINAINYDFVNVEFYDGTGTLASATMQTSELDLELVSPDADLWTVTFQLTEK